MADRASTVLDSELAVSRLGGDRQLYDNLLADFGDRHGDFAVAMHAALTGGDGAAARRLAHGLKSAAGSLGATCLQQAAAHLEELFRAGNFQHLPEALGETELELGLVLAELAALPAVVRRPAVSEHPGLGGDAVTVLRQLVAQDDAEALGVAGALARQWAGGPGHGAMERIHTLLRHYDFGGALAIIDDPFENLSAARPPG